ncbi:MAG: class I mannose-6-phosphate isomerase [Prevotellaceae bacterium]|jgi:mannose-6-phosphate isomerase|nr:class I mannose-6-phosphate isomerase [Prevotellaceae bacterium]
MLYPLKFTPILKPKLWGGTKLSTLYRRQSDGAEAIGESWDVSGVAGNESVVANGFLAGNTLNELVEVYLGDLVGEAVYERYGDEFPLLVKLIDATQYLSIQVHPNDEMAAEQHNAQGKTEMWYVLSAEKNACIIAGFTHPVTREACLQHVENGTLEQIVQRFEVAAGDIFFIPPGTVHAIGQGCVILEIQQTSDITYRLFDYNRTDANGNRRELHIDLAMEAIDFVQWKHQKTVPQPIERGMMRLVESPHFTVNQLLLDRPQELRLTEIDSFVLLTVVEGALRYEYAEHTDTVRSGETILLPAEIDAIQLFPNETVKLLEVYIVSKLTPQVS